MNYNNLSDEQKSLIAAVKRGDNVLCDACIGSGKTTTIQELCNVIKDKNILYLTYSSLLKLDARSKIQYQNTDVHSYHSFAYMILKENHINIKTLGFNETIKTFNLLENIENMSYDLLIVDEYQDLEKDFSMMLEKIKEYNPDIQIVMVGDMEQKIFDKTNFVVPNFVKRFLGKYTTIKFTKCFRISKELASFLGDVWNKEIYGANEKCDVVEMTQTNLIKYLAKCNPSDVLCLGAKTGEMTKILNELESLVPEKYNKNTVYATIKDNDNKKVDDKCAVFTTYDSCKGMERRCCVVCNFDERYWNGRMKNPEVKYEILRNLFCVAASRGKGKIIFLSDKNCKVNFSNLSWKTKQNFLSTPVETKHNYSRPFMASDMFDYKYDEDIDECMRYLTIKDLKTDKTDIKCVTHDGRIDISPCIGMFQEVNFFKNDTIDGRVAEAKVKADIYGYALNLKTNKEDDIQKRILELMSYETMQARYYNQVENIIDESNIKLINERLSAIFTGDEAVQVMKAINEDKYGIKLRCVCDVIKDDVVYELKFKETLSNTDFLQLAVYMIVFNKKKGILFNTKNNSTYELSIKKRDKMFNSIIKCITKGTVRDLYPEDFNIDIK